MLREVDPAALPPELRTLHAIDFREERPFSVSEAKAAREAFLTAARPIVMPVIKLDGQTVGDGRPGEVALALRAEFHRVAEAAD